ncbi:MAG: N-acetyltransferase [bacterium]|jgi:predicted GNAT family acetyltransferase|nr:N-acetyltransferase [bacterium]
MSGEPPRVVRDAAASRFVLHDAGVEAELLFRHRGNRLILVHTEVPDELGGRGIGGQLVRAAIDWAERDALMIVPFCPFARKWLADHPQATTAVTIDWGATQRNTGAG